MPTPHHQKIAVLIDINQFSHRHLPSVLEQAYRIGKPVIIRAYGIWTAQNVIVWHQAAQKWGMALVDNSPITDKDTTFLTLTIDALTLYHTQSIDNFLLCIHHEKYIPLLEFFKQNAITYQLICSQVNAHAFLNVSTDLLTTESIAQTKPAISLSILKQAIINTADILGWASLNKIQKSLACSMPNIHKKDILFTCQFYEDFLIHQLKNNQAWIRLKNHPTPKTTITNDIHAIIHIIQCINQLNEPDQPLWLEDIATLLNHHKHVLPEHYSHNCYLDLLLELPFLSKQILNGKIIIQYHNPTQYYAELAELFLSGGTITPVNTVDIENLPKLSGLKKPDGIYGQWLVELVKEFSIPTTKKAAYEILHRILITYPQIDSADFGHKRWLGVFQSSHLFDVTEKEQIWIGLADN